MKRYEYGTEIRVIGAQYAQNEFDMLERYGRHGWLLTTTREETDLQKLPIRIYYFAREIPE